MLSDAEKKFESQRRKAVVQLWTGTEYGLRRNEDVAATLKISPLTILTATIIVAPKKSRSRCPDRPGRDNVLPGVGVSTISAGAIAPVATLVIRPPFTAGLTITIDRSVVFVTSHVATLDFPGPLSRFALPNG